MMTLILLMILVLIILNDRGYRRASRPLWRPGQPIVRDESLRLIIFVILVLLLIGVLARLILPLGNYPGL
jgi:TRAP-type C4-dicarboxylate transport system permease large subunit